MLVWLSIVLFQSMFGIEITGDAILLLRVFGWFELFIELAAIAFITGIYVWDKLEKRKG